LSDGLYHLATDNSKAVGRRARAKAVAIQEMTGPSQSPRDCILWILANNGDKMDRAD